MQNPYNYNKVAFFNGFESTTSLETRSSSTRVDGRYVKYCRNHQTFVINQTDESGSHYYSAWLNSRGWNNNNIHPYLDVFMAILRSLSKMTSGKPLAMNRIAPLV